MEDSTGQNQRKLTDSREEEEEEERVGKKEVEREKPSTPSLTSAESLKIYKNGAEKALDIVNRESLLSSLSLSFPHAWF